jgi:hypothetical protein
MSSTRSFNDIHRELLDLESGRNEFALTHMTMENISVINIIIYRIKIEEINYYVMLRFLHEPEMCCEIIEGIQDKYTNYINFI